MKKAIAKSPKAIKSRTKLEWILLIALLLIAYLWLAGRYSWWPSNMNQGDDLGTAFYVASRDDAKESLNTIPNTGGTRSATTTNSTNNTTGNNGTSGNNGANGQDGKDGKDGTNGSNNTPPGKSPILTLAAGIDVGDSKEELLLEANGLNGNCTVIADLPLLGKQEVCSFREDNKLITVTLLNNEVVSASRTGF